MHLSYKGRHTIVDLNAPIWFDPCPHCGKMQQQRKPTAEEKAARKRQARELLRLSAERHGVTKGDGDNDYFEMD